MKLTWRRASAAGVVTNVVLFGAVSVVVFRPLSASSIIFNTGVDDGGLFLNPGAIDPHYSLIVGGTNAYVASGATIEDSAKFPVPPGWPVHDRYVSSSTAQWVAPIADVVSVRSAGTYEYVTSFDLSGYDPNKFEVTGRFSVDNSSGGVYLNGKLAPNTATTDIYGFLGFINFDITTGFNSGVNTLAFVVDNSPMLVAVTGPNPTGLLVEVASAGPPIDPPSPNPEPAVIWLSGGGLAVLMLRQLRRRKRA